MKKVWPENYEKIMNCHIAFRIHVKRANYLEICALNTYSVYINGEFIHYGPARAAHGYIRKDKVDLDAYKNFTLVIIVNGYNVNNYYTCDEQPCFGAEIFSDGVAVYSTDDFQCYNLADTAQNTQRYSFQRTFTEIYHLSSARNDFYHGKDVFKKLKVKEVIGYIEVERGVSMPLMDKVTGKLCESGKVIYVQREEWKYRSMYPTKDFKTYALEDVEEVLSETADHFGYEKAGIEGNTLRDNEYFVYDFGRTYTGFFGLNIQAETDCELYVLFDEIDWQESEHSDYINIKYNRNTCVNIVKWNLKKGDYNLLTSEPYTGRFFKCVIKSGCASIDEFLLITYENVRVNYLKVKKADEKVAAIIQAAQNTLSQNAVDILTDCPSRERAGWLCDGYFSGKAEMLLFGDNAVEKNFLENYANAPQSVYLPEGMIPMCYPGDNPNGVYIPNWSLWYIEELYDYFKRTGDKNLINKSREKVEGVLKFFEKYENEYDLLEDLESWIFVEWSRANDRDFVAGVNFPSNMLYAHTLSLAGELYGCEKYIEKAKKIVAAIRKISYNGRFFEDNAIRNRKGELILIGHMSEACQYYALYFNIASKEEFPELYSTLLHDFTLSRDASKIHPKVFKANAIVGTTLRLLYYLREGEISKVLNESIGYYYPMSQRTGTLWEHDRPSGSLNHGFASIGAKIILECAFGYCGYDKDKKIIFMRRIEGGDFEIEVPVGERRIEISKHKGKINISDTAYVLKFV